MSYQKTSDFFAFMFFPKDNLLVVLGRDDAIREAVNVVSKILYPDAENLKVFSSVEFGIDSMVNTINQMKKNDPGSWCNDFNAKYDAQKYEGKKTKYNFSLGERNCVLDDPEVKKAISQSSSISPKYKFCACRKLNQLSYDRPKAISFNGKDGVISISIPQIFEDWYRFISEFLLTTLIFNS